MPRMAPADGGSAPFWCDQRTPARSPDGTKPSVLLPETSGIVACDRWCGVTAMSFALPWPTSTPASKASTSKETVVDSSGSCAMTSSDEVAATATVWVCGWPS